MRAFFVLLEGDAPHQLDPHKGGWVDRRSSALSSLCTATAAEASQWGDLPMGAAITGAHETGRSPLGHALG